MSKRPSFQFYAGDWQSNTKLKRCSYAEKGMWLEIMLIMHDSEEYGILRWTLKEIAMALGCPVSHIKQLVDKDILKGIDNHIEKVSYSTEIAQKNAPPIKVDLLKNEVGPLWFSSKMIRDEYIRVKRGANGVKSLNNVNVPRKKEHEKVTDMVKDKDTFSPSPLSSSSSSILKDQDQTLSVSKKRTDERFEEFWTEYPRKENKKTARARWISRKLDAHAAEIIADVRARREQHRPWLDGYVPHASTYLNGERWKDAIDDRPASNGKSFDYATAEDVDDLFR